MSELYDKLAGSFKDTMNRREACLFGLPVSLPYSRITPTEKEKIYHGFKKLDKKLGTDWEGYAKEMIDSVDVMMSHLLDIPESAEAYGAAHDFMTIIKKIDKEAQGKPQISSKPERLKFENSLFNCGLPYFRAQREPDKKYPLSLKELLLEKY